MALSCLSETNFSGANLSGTILLCADLSRANFQDTVLRGATLSGSKLVFTDFRGASLLDANLLLTDFSRAELSAADLSGALRGSAAPIPGWSLQPNGRLMRTAAAPQNAKRRQAARA